MSKCSVVEGRPLSISQRKYYLGLVPKWPIVAHEGFTLLEMLVSIAVIGVVLVAIFKMQSGTTRLSSSGDFYDTAPHLARMKLSEIVLGLAEKFPDQEREGHFGDSFPDYEWRYVLTPLEINGSRIPSELGESDGVKAVLGDEILERIGRIDLEISHSLGMTFHLTQWLFLQNHEPDS